MTDIFSGENIPTNTDLSKECAGTMAGKEELDNFVFPCDLPSYLPTQEELDKIHEEACEQTAKLDKIFNGDTTIDEDTGEVTTITTTKEPRLTPATDGQGYKAIVITMADDEEETKAEIEKRALTNPRLAEALKSGKKTWEGFFRFWQNKTRDMHREFSLGSKPVVVHREDVWNMAEEYFCNDKLRDISNKPANTDKPKKEPKPKAQKPKSEKKTKVVPLTPQMGSLFGDDDF